MSGQGVRLSAVRSGDILSLQHTVGNQAVQRILRDRAGPTIKQDSPPAGPASPTIQRVLNPQQMQALYAFPHPLNITPDELNNIFENNSGPIKGWLAANGNLKQAMQKLITYLKAENGNYQQRYQNLFDFNTFFGGDELQLGNGPKDVNAATGRQMMIALNALGGTTPADIRSIYNQKGVGEIWTIFQNDPNFSLLAVTQTIRQSGGTIQHLGYGELATLRVVLQQHPPTSGLGGGMNWGKGELPSVEVNKEAHFLKHCLRQYNADSNPDQSEPWKWLGILGYAIKKDDVEHIVGSLDPTISNRIFGNGDRVPDEAHADFFFNTYLKTQPALINHLKADYMPHYVNYVKASTSSLASPFVTVNNGKVQVVGVSGGQFIVGKWDPQANAFTISSSYLNLAKVNENLPFKVWAL